MDQEREFSLRLSNCVDYLGYSAQQIHWRREAYKERDRLWNENSRGSTFLTVGSKGEGLSKYFESDHDILVAPKNILCLESGFKQTDPGESRLIYRMHMDRRCTPGYTLLGSEDGYICSEWYLKQTSEALRTVKMAGYNEPISSGPAQSLSIRCFNVDMVYAFRCKCPTVLQEWATRSRCTGWPSENVISDVLEADAFLVAKGSETSPLRLFEWRLCFNIAENLLVQSLTDTQTKLYVLLKIVVKDILKPKQKEITSFVVKNSVFWLCELYPYEQECLVTLLMKALRMLLHSFRSNALPYYMVPHRNLLAGKMTPEQRQCICAQLSKMLDEGPKFLLGSKTLHEVLVRFTPREMEEFKNTRDETEMLFVTWCLEFYSLQSPQLSSKQKTRRAERNMKYILYAIYDKVFPDWRKFRKGELSVFDIAIVHLEEMLS